MIYKILISLIYNMKTEMKVNMVRLVKFIQQKKDEESIHTCPIATLKIISI